MAETNTSRTLRYLRKQDYKCGIVERYNQYTKQRYDLFNIFDIIAYRVHDKEILGVQSCAGSGFNEHDKKILANENTKGWLDAGGKIMLIAWRKLKTKKKDNSYSKKYKWHPKIKYYKNF